MTDDRLAEIERTDSDGKSTPRQLTENPHPGT